MIIKNFALFILIIFLLSIFFFLRKKNPDKIEPYATYLFWTGGYDSTFRLCQLLLVENKMVKPVYLAMDNVDSPYTNLIQHRKNKYQEIKTMNNIRKYLGEIYPQTKKTLLPTLYIHNIPQNKYINKAAYDIHYNLKKFARPITQYERMARFSFYYPIKSIEVGLEKCGTGLDRATKEFRIGHGENCKLTNNLPNYAKSLGIFKKFRYPMVHMTKKDCYEYAKKYGFDEILKKTWSCWFPSASGKPCNKCQMCKYRFKMI